VHPDNYLVFLLKAAVKAAFFLLPIKPFAMNIAAYIRERNALIEHIENIDIVTDNNLLSHLTLTSANYRKLMPWLPPASHLQYFKHIILHQQLSALEHKHTDSLEFLSLEGFTTEIKDLLLEKPSIICTFHSGSYRLLNTFLMQRQVPYALVAARNILQKQRNSYLETFDHLHLSYLYHEFTLIEAESPSCGLQMLRALKEGKSLLVYIDGNTGVKTDHSKSHLTQFFNGKLFARSGVPYLAYAAMVPIINAIGYRRNIDEPSLRFFDPIYPDTSLDRQSFCETTVQQIYNNFASLMQDHPEQWEAWMYLHRSIYFDISNNYPVVPEANLLGLVRADRERFGLINTTKSKLLFDKDSYLSYPVNDHLYASLFQELFR
jgi:lauroyl/myristoyl acyltransferase